MQVFSATVVEKSTVTLKGERVDSLSAYERDITRRNSKTVTFIKKIIRPFRSRSFSKWGRIQMGRGERAY
jgi:hypothetical protein